MVWIITCNKDNGAVGTSLHEPKFFDTKQAALDWISENKGLFPDCKLDPEECKPVGPGIITATIETKEPPEISGYQIYQYDFSNF
ncbi:hypothetical protein [Acidithiobacillus ferrivorans]|uniref:Uncharacterized protein n=1 Tax=Acidithiobacillus ferrivorans TaxID=160808 RepID=A0A7T4WDC6_9PROT|nr:hypothetical protein [Acidithiobacillus ferrivorans]QQD72320.1 hypothetical protein H2515_13085 [Acidithiobacillus ferrivorans]